MINEDVLTVLVLTDTEQLADVLVKIMHRRLPSVSAIAIPFQRCTSQLTPHLLYQADLLVVELLRKYPGGIRAEGVALAKRRLQRERGFLIVSPLSLPALACPGYWDTTARDGLGDRAQSILHDPESAARNFDRVALCFDRLLTLPPQH